MKVLHESRRLHGKNNAPLASGTSLLLLVAADFALWRSYANHQADGGGIDTVTARGDFQQAAGPAGKMGDSLEELAARQGCLRLIGY